MKCLINIFLLTLLASGSGYAQIYTTRTGFIGFYSKTPLEDIRAEKKQVYAAIDLSQKTMAFMVLLKGFIFPKELMQEHFNENYVESDKYPKATFSGIYTGNISSGKEAAYQVMVVGTLRLHQVARQIEVPATLELKNGRLMGTAEFVIRPEDYNISIPSLVRDKIDKQLRIRIEVNCLISK